MADEKVSTEVDVTQFLIGYDGKPLTDPKMGPDNEPVKDANGEIVREKVPFRKIVFTALEFVGRLDEDKGMAPSVKMDAYKLAHLVATQDKVTLTTEDLALLEKRIGMAFPMNVVGAATMILNPGKMKG